MSDFKSKFQELIQKRFKEEFNKQKETSEESIPEDYYVLNKLIDYKAGGYGNTHEYVIADSISWVDQQTDEYFGPFPFEWKNIGDAFKGLNTGNDIAIVPKIRVVTLKEESRKVKIKDIFTRYREHFINQQGITNLEDFEPFLNYYGSGISFAANVLSVVVLCEYESKNFHIILDYDSASKLTDLFKIHKEHIIGKEFDYTFNPCKIVKAKDGFVYDEKTASTSSRIVTSIEKAIPKKAPDVKPTVSRRKSK